MLSFTFHPTFSYLNNNCTIIFNISIKISKRFSRIINKIVIISFIRYERDFNSKRTHNLEKNRTIHRCIKFASNPTNQIQLPTFHNRLSPFLSIKYISSFQRRWKSETGYKVGETINGKFANQRIGAYRWKIIQEGAGRRP